MLPTNINGGHVANSNCQGWAAEVEERQAEAEVLHHHCQTQHFTDQKLSSTIFPLILLFGFLRRIGDISTRCFRTLMEH